ncbi:MAG: hypothetical protein KGI38_03775 [Thaumarchaeota archaeon]|nr:hypothetical protein [Nitrososphaerota archaeon]
MKGIRRPVLIILVASLSVAGIALSLFVAGLGASTSSATSQAAQLPPGCVKPANGFLIIASAEGFNDSIPHGVPKVFWPVITVDNGSEVNIVVCNTDTQAHGFQVQHYSDSNIEVVPPGQVIHVSFYASESGSFQIYCSIFCTIHFFMQWGKLIVR